MIIPDVNLLVFAHNNKAPQHHAARTWWERSLNGLSTIGLCWIVINGFLRLMTHPRVLVQPMPIDKAVTYAEAWLKQPCVRLIEPGKKFPFLFFNYLQQIGAGGNLTTDAYLAALAIEHHAELYSNDTDFSRFVSLHWKNPLN